MSGKPIYKGQDPISQQNDINSLKKEKELLLTTISQLNQSISSQKANSPILESLRTQLQSKEQALEKIQSKINTLHQAQEYDPADIWVH